MGDNDPGPPVPGKTRHRLILGGISVATLGGTLAAVDRLVVPYIQSAVEQRIRDVQEDFESDFDKLEGRVRRLEIKVNDG